MSRATEPVRDALRRLAEQAVPGGTLPSSVRRGVRRRQAFTTGTGLIALTAVTLAGVWGVRLLTSPSTPVARPRPSFGLTGPPTPGATSTTPGSSPVPSCTDGWVTAPAPPLPGDQAVGHLVAVAAASHLDVWAVGRWFEGGQSVPYPLIEHWDGMTWTVVPGADIDDSSGSLTAVAALASNDVWAVGTFGGYGDGGQSPLIQHWDGATWTLLPSPALGDEDGEGIPRSLDAIAAVSSDDIWVLGRFQPLPEGAVASVSRDAFLHWDGVSWSTVPSPQDETNTGTSAMQDVSAASGSDVWAVGGRVDAFGEAGTAGGALVERWDGAAWTRVTAPPGEVPLTKVAATSSSDVWAVRGGAFTSHGTHLFGPFELLHWDGDAWTSTLTLPEEDGTQITDILAVASDDVWAVGMTEGHPRIQHWDGAAWSVADYGNTRQFSFAWQGSAARAAESMVVVLASNLAPSASPENLLWFRCDAGQ